MNKQRFDEMVDRLGVASGLKFQIEEQVRSYLSLQDLRKDLFEEIEYTQNELDELADEIIRQRFWFEDEN
jgi:hypothetical protein